MNKRDKMKLEKIRIIVNSEEENIRSIAASLYDAVYYDCQSDEDFNKYFFKRIYFLEKKSIILTHKIKIFKKLCNSIPKRKKNE